MLENASLRIDPHDFAEGFNVRQFPVTHSLAENPLFSLPNLLSLAERVAGVARSEVYYDLGVTDVGQRWSSTPPAATLRATLERINAAGAWIDIKSAELDPPYARVLDCCIGDLLAISGPELKRKMRRTQMAIFITSPNRLSTYHIDSECNFLLQIRGRKQISIFDKFDREVLPEEEIERSWTVDTNAALYKPHLQNRADVVMLSPGMGVHIPVNAPHWVQNGDDVSVSAAILFHWWNSEYANVYAANYCLRQKLGLHPRPPRESAVTDLVKQPLGAAFSRLRRMRHGPLRS